MPKKPEDTPRREGRLSLTIREDLLVEFKMQAVRERTSMSELTERMIVEYSGPTPASERRTAGLAA